MLKEQFDERLITVTKAEALAIPSVSPYTLRLNEVPADDPGVVIRRVSPTTKVGTGSGSCVSGGVYSGLTAKSYKIQIDTTGDIGTATFKWSPDNGVTWLGELIPIPDTDPIELELDVTVQFAEGTGQDFDLDDYFTFTVEFWAEVDTIPIQSKEYQVNYVTGSMLFHSADAGKAIQVSYEGRGSLAAADIINQIIAILNIGENVIRNVDTSSFVANQAVAVLADNTYQLANATDDTKSAIGFVKVVHATEGEILLSGPLDGFTGLVAGLRYFLNVIDGAISATLWYDAGNIVQVVGKALSSTVLLVDIAQDYQTVSS